MRFLKWILTWVQKTNHSSFLYIYLHQGGYVFTWVCLWVSKFVCEQDTSLLMDFDFQDMSEKVNGRNDSISGVTQITI